MKSVLRFLVFMGGIFLAIAANAQSNYRIFPYLQIADQNLVQVRWFAGQAFPSSIVFKDSKGNVLISKEVQGMEMADLYYTEAEKTQILVGLEGQNWIGAEKYVRYDFTFRVPFNEGLTYEVTLNGQKYTKSIKPVPDPKAWETIRFIALADSETEPLSRVSYRAWYPGQPLIRPFATPALWKQKFGTTSEQGFEIPNYFMTETDGYAANLKIVNRRTPDFVLMPGDLVQGGGYMPAWDEFWRHNAGDYDAGFSTYPIVAALGNWEAFGAVNGGYGMNEKGKFSPMVGRSRFHAFFELDIEDSLQKHRQSYYRTDYGPITILTLDSSNGEPEEKRSDTPEDQKLKGKAFSGPGTDTQENFTLAQYNAAGGTDLSGFGPGSPQYIWLEANLKEARENQRLIFVQFHHISFSSGEHGVAMNHELSTGQGGTPLRVLHPLFEKYGVIAVMSGHDELFERSFVDNDKDGTGVHYYDVGVAGDGMRGVKRNWNSNPLETMDYNEFSQWTADQHSPEQWNTAGAVPVLTDGGKHYGHLEVNLKKSIEGNQEFALINFSPVYVFPVMDQNYDLHQVERRVYKDELNLKIPLRKLAVEPTVKDSVAIYLDTNGKANLTSADFLAEIPEDGAPFTFQSSMGYEFGCANLGLNEITITTTNTESGKKREDLTRLYVLDTIKPYFDAAPAAFAFDPIVGKVEFSGADFAIFAVEDNCTGPFAMTFSRSTTITCEDLAEYEKNLKINVDITVTDPSGNARTVKTYVTLNPIESVKVSLESRSELYEGKTAEIALGTELEYEVLAWYKESQELFGVKGKVIQIDAPGHYSALLRLPSGCTVYSNILEVKYLEVKYQTAPYPAVKKRIELGLDGAGNATLSGAAIFESWPFSDPKLSAEVSMPTFTCENLGAQEVIVTIKEAGGDQWEEKIEVIVRDQTKPVLVSKNVMLEFDVTKSVLEITPETLLSEFGDNCGIKSLTITKNRFTCEDVGKEFAVAIRAEDKSGNVSEAVAMVTITRSESEKVVISGKREICAGEKSILELSSTKAFEVVRWRRNGIEITGQSGKVLEVTESGKYHAVIRYVGGCLSETVELEVKVNAKPDGKITEDGNILRAPAGDFTYQWFRNGQKIQGAFSRTFTAEQMGEYTVEMTGAGACKYLLEPVTLTISGIIGRPVQPAIDLKIYPNPAADRAIIELPDGVLSKNPEIVVYSTEGKNVSSDVQFTEIGDSKIEIQLNGLSKGTYLIWIVGENQKTYFGKLVVVN